MKLKTKFQDDGLELGEVADVNIATMPDGRIKAQAIAETGVIHTFFYDKLQTFWNDWEDASEEPKGVKSIYFIGAAVYIEMSNQKEAIEVEEKLEAYRRLRDKGFKFRWIDMQAGQIKYSFYLKDDQKITRKDEDDLLLLFGGEE